MSKLQIHNGYKNSSGIYPQAVHCSDCDQIVIAELDPISEYVTLYNIESNSKNQRVVHEHLVDAITMDRLKKRVATEMRLFGEIDPDDWVYCDTDNGDDNTKV